MGGLDKDTLSYIVGENSVLGLVACHTDAHMFNWISPKDNKDE